MDKGPFKDSIVAQLLKLSSIGGTLKHWEPKWLQLKLKSGLCSICYENNAILYHQLYRKNATEAFILNGINRTLSIKSYSTSMLDR